MITPHSLRGKELSIHSFLGHPVTTIYPPRTYSVQVENATALEDERIATFL